MNYWFLVCYLAGGATVGAWWWWINNRAKARALVAQGLADAKKK